MINDLKTNISQEMEMLKEIGNYLQSEESGNLTEKNILKSSIESTLKRLKIVNSAIPVILSGITSAQPIDQKGRKTELEKLAYSSESGIKNVILNQDDKERFLSELSINNEAMGKIKKIKINAGEKISEFAPARGYFKISNLFFMNFARKLIEKGYFRGLYSEIKKSNIDVLFETYIAGIFFATLISILFSVFILAFLVFFEINLSIPFITVFEGNKFIRLLSLSWILIAIPLATFFSLYYYPSTERGSIATRIERELPFAVIHMGAIAGSGVEPTNIFKIIALSREYPALRKEIRKIVNQINLYGYDFVTALSNSAKNSPSQKLAELLSGLSNTITSGGDLTAFFEKRAETLLLNYRLEREKFTKTAETFMDVYITVVIAAPMILLLIFIMLSISDFDIGLSPKYLTFLIIIIIGLVNVVFLSLLHLKQPIY